MDTILDYGFQLVVSDLTENELSKKTGLSRDVILQEYLKPYEMVGKLTIVEITREMIKQAESYSRRYRLHASDVLHALIAKREECILVTRDEELRTKGRKIGVRTGLPEELV